ncbi:hypothetical protein LOTGIDRAFT_229218 [Lottia gigantea]|uniref:PEST proteolytic signal-containing nuclear protein n=1 Tax=Lottia gigantea TaxID=225164 RepID=V3ZYB4_LOTGI|nr:hypothetical protein LOTGIDRAFT_229218 [Lottia gigantea]ESO89367.1 hypothetical protein LOTGIDRAFT_229218 [Lottia gigantea]
MADKSRDITGTDSEKSECGYSPAEKPEKRKSTGEDGPPTKKITMNIKSLNQDPAPKPLMGFGIKKPAGGIKMSLNSQKPKEVTVTTAIVKKSTTVAQAFNSDSEEEEEEMPPEAKMRMKNVGRLETEYLSKENLYSAYRESYILLDFNPAFPCQLIRETPTAAGPNSFGKGKLGFTNHHRILEKEIEKQIKESGD